MSDLRPRTSQPDALIQGENCTCSATMPPLEIDRSNCPIHAPVQTTPSKPIPERTRYWILKDIQDERERQDAKWGGTPGVERRDDHTYAAVLTEEVGEACKAWLEREPMDLRAELIQVAAVAIAWVEELDNGGMATRA